MIIFDEKNQYNNLIKNGFKRFVNVTDLSILGREWVRNGLKKDEIRQKMINFAKKHKSDFNEYKYEDKLNLALQKSFEQGLQNKKIFFYKEELEFIKSCNDYKQEKLLFILFCLAKWNSKEFVYLRTNENNIIKLTEVFKLANITEKVKKQEYLLHSLYKNDYIDCNFKPLLRVDINNINKGSQKVLEFEPNYNMIAYYNKYINKKVKFCTNCNSMFSPNNNRQNLCFYCK